MKKLIFLVIVIVLVGYVVRHLSEAGMDQIEQTTQIQAKANERLLIIRQITDDKPTESSRVVQEHTETPSVAPRPEVALHQSVMEIRTGDSICVVLLRLGNPPAEELVNDLRILKYRSCNIIVRRDAVVGWLLK